MPPHRLAVFALIIASSSSFQSFQTISSFSQQRGSSFTTRVTRRVSASSSNPDYTNNDSFGDAMDDITSKAQSSISRALSDEPDAYETELANRKRRVKERSQSYIVTLPLSKRSADGDSSILSMGLTLIEVKKGRTLSSQELVLDSLQVRSIDDMSDQGDDVLTLDQLMLNRKLDGDFQGILVNSVVKGSAAWAAGVRPGDILIATSATLGDGMWPKTTLGGVLSAVSSRRAAAASVQFEFQRIREAVDDQFELTLTRPIGLELKETEDGFVEVTGFTENAPNLVRYAVSTGDRVLAVESSLGGKMWPVSTVDGVISAVTGRLPGQQITLRFQRAKENMERGATKQVSSSVSVGKESKTELVSTASAPVDQKKLIAQCRQIIRRYMTGEQQEARAKFVGKYSVPAMVADKVVDALSNAEATVDSMTLSMIMSAYLSCGQTEGAIQAFQAVTGVNADGSTLPFTVEVQSESGRRITPNKGALTEFPVSALLKAHAMNGDLASVRRVLAALEGRSGESIDGVEVAAWPQTGPNGKVQPDTRCYNVAMAALTELDTVEGLDAAIQLFESMQVVGAPAIKKPKRDIVSYNTIINALSQDGQNEKAIDLFYDMKQQGIKPDKFSYTALVKSISRDEDIKELLYDMKEQGINPDVIMYNTIIKGLCQEKKFLAAQRMVNRMESEGVSPDSMTYGLLMSSLLRSGNPGACLTLFESACADSRTTALTENINLYTTAITAASAIGDHDRALELLTRMNALGIKANMKTLTALMGASLSSGKPAFAVDIYRRISKPDGYATYHGMLALCETGEIEEVLNTMRQQRRKTLQLSGKEQMTIFDKMLTKSLESRDYDMARRTFSELIRQNNIPSKYQFRQMFESMKLFPAVRRGLNTAIVDDEVEDGREKFSFLLFLLDSIREKNLPCEGPLYSAILFYGARLRGLPRKIASLLAVARSVSDGGGVSVLDESDLEGCPTDDSWENMFLNYDDVKNNYSTPESLPCLQVRIASRDLPRVLKAEQSLVFGGRKQNSSRRRR